MNEELKFATKSEIGLVRDINEDSTLANPPLFVVADGMGGHMAGDVASQLVVKSLSQSVLDDADALLGAVRQANEAVFNAANENKDLSGMGTTLTAMYAGRESAQIVHVGDSRAYLLRDGRLRQITTDHTVVGRLVAQGRLDDEEAKVHPQRSMLERALGVDPDVEIDVELLDTQPGDRILLCSDGLTGMLTDEQIEEILERAESPEAAANQLCDAAVRAGGHDNVTVVVVDYPGERKRPKTAAPRAGVAPRRKSRRVLTAAVLLLLVLLAALWGRATIKSSWYVGLQDGKVAVFNGVPGSVIGIELSTVEKTTDVQAANLPPVYRDRVAEGIRATDPEHADAIVDDLRQLATVATTPVPSTTTPPSPTPS